MNEAPLYTPEPDATFLGHYREHDLYLSRHPEADICAVVARFGHAPDAHRVYDVDDGDLDDPVFTEALYRAALAGLPL